MISGSVQGSELAPRLPSWRWQPGHGLYPRKERSETKACGPDRLPRLRSGFVYDNAGQLELAVALRDQGGAPAIAATDQVPLSVLHDEA